MVRRVVQSRWLRWLRIAIEVHSFVAFGAAMATIIGGAAGLLLRAYTSAGLAAQSIVGLSVFLLILSAVLTAWGRYQRPLPEWYPEHIHMEAEGEFGEGVLMDVVGPSDSGFRSFRCEVAAPGGARYLAEPSHADMKDPMWPSDGERFRFPEDFEPDCPRPLATGMYRIVWSGLRDDEEDVFAVHRIMLARDSFRVLPGGRMVG